MFIRYNEVAKYWEYDSSNGAGAGPWIILPIVPSQITGILPPASLPSNVAYRDINNSFSQGQNITGNVVATGLIQAGTYFHEAGRVQPMGYWQNIPFNAANFKVGTGTGTWTMGAGNIHNNRFALVGKTLFWAMYVSWFNGATIAGDATALSITLPLGLTASGTNYQYVGYGQDYTGFTDMFFSASGSNVINITRKDNGAFGTSPGWISTFVLEVN